MATLSPLRPKRHLPGVDRGKTSDPYVVIEFAGSIRKSKVCKKTLSPVWDFRCEFDYEPGEVKISVYDWNLVMRRKLLLLTTRAKRSPQRARSHFRLSYQVKTNFYVRIFQHNM